MATVIIRNLDDELAERIKREALRHGLSLNKYLQHLLAKSPAECVSGTDKNASPRNDLRKLSGRWTASQARAFSAAIKPVSKIEPDMWK